VTVFLLIAGQASTDKLLSTSMLCTQQPLKSHTHTFKPTDISNIYTIHSVFIV